MDRNKISIQNEPEWWKKREVESERIDFLLGDHVSDAITLKQIFEYGSNAEDQEEIMNMICLLFNLPPSLVMTVMAAIEGRIE